MASDKTQIGKKENEPQVEGNQLAATPEGNGARLSRSLGLAEQVLLERQKINEWGAVTTVLLMESTKELDQGHLSKALHLVSQRYPLLRMRINESGGDNEAGFEEMENSNTVDFELLDKITADNWIEGLEEEINDYQFDFGRGPLWRVHETTEGNF